MQEETEVSKVNWSLIIVLSITISFVCILLFAAVNLSSCSCGFLNCLSQMAPNEIGDTLAGVFSAGAFIGLIITLLLQMQELKLQRNELSLTRVEFKAMKEAAQGSLDIERSKEADQEFWSLLSVFCETSRSADRHKIRIMYIKNDPERGSQFRYGFFPSSFFSAGNIIEIPTNKYPEFFDNLSNNIDAILNQALETKDVYQVNFRGLKFLKNELQKLQPIRDQLGQGQRVRYDSYKIDKMVSQLEEILKHSD